jgi:hypothetical protein
LELLGKQPGASVSLGKYGEPGGAAKSSEGARASENINKGTILKNKFCEFFISIP